MKHDINNFNQWRKDIINNSFYGKYDKAYSRGLFVGAGALVIGTLYFITKAG